ncbi:hypothetical protein [uncultured Roseibium sp.]|uniref:hypothetical protein n=1 Tax=uncultured Roseibium sp. TaxID=1936171 RepID=UPI003216C313
MSKFRFYYKYPWLFIGASLLIGLFMVYLGSESVASAKLLEPGDADQLEDLLVMAVGRQVRRSNIGGLEWPIPIAPGYALSPSAASIKTRVRR